MAFRQAKNRDDKAQEAWSYWIARCRPELTSMGLPPEVHLSLEHWQDFLENGYLELHPQDSTGFEFADLPPAVLGALRRFLERHYGKANPCPPLLGWLRVRYRQGSIA